MSADFVPSHIQGKQINKNCGWSKYFNTIGRVNGTQYLPSSDVQFRNHWSTLTAVNSQDEESITLTTQFHPAACPVPLAE
jgi:hypothetical protein